MTSSEAMEAISGMFDVWYSPLVRFASRQIGSTDAAEDMVQEAFLSLFRNLMADQKIENPKAWLLCVVRREAIKQHRESCRHGGPFQELTESMLRTDHESDTGTFWAQVERDDLTRLFATLSAREEEVILLRVKGLKYREIAGALSITVGSVKTMMARALDKMQAARFPDSIKKGAPNREEAAR